MQIVKQGYQFIYPTTNKEFINEAKKIEAAGRLCYKSEDKITEDSYKKFISMLREKQHGAMLEHSTMSIKFITDRGITHEIVRHRVASFAQESTRYCNYSKDKFNNEISVIEPFCGEADDESYRVWLAAMEAAEKAYFKMLELGYSPQISRSVLPTSLKTEIVVTANFREWLHIFKLRTAPAAHPQMVALMTPLYKELNSVLPEIFTLS